MHIEQDVVNFEMSDADAKSGPVKGTDIAVDIAKGLTRGSRTNEHQTNPNEQTKVVSSDAPF